MQLLDKRIKGICDDLGKWRKKSVIPITDWQYKSGFYLNPEQADQDSGKWEVFDGNQMHWYGPDRHYWFRRQLTVPADFDGQSLWLNIRTQIEEWDDAKNPQFLLFIDNKVVQGIDMNHRQVLIQSEAKAGQTMVIDLQAYTGTLHHEFNFLVELMSIDATIEKLYYDLFVPWQAFERLDKEGAAYRNLEAVLNQTINLLDLRNPYSDDFYASLAVAQNYIEQELYQKLGGYDEVIATCIGHTHIDVAWWWTVEQTREKVARSFATVLKLMDEYPDYKFMSSQPQLYEFLKQRYPELYAQVKQRIEQKRWEAEGGMWVEADCNLTSGESLVRQFLYGKKFFREEFGIDNQILWLPDVFGYSAALPQIMDKCGIKYFMTTKLSWNQFNQFPQDTFLWKGIDGTKILTHLISTLDVGQNPKNFFTTYNGRLHPDAIMGGWQRYQNKDINNDILISFGYGDGGGGPTREMLETAKRMEKGIQGIPKVRMAFAGDYYQELEQRVSDHQRLPQWEGELYFEYHRGTLTSMARNKKANRKSEFLLADLEFISLLAEKEWSYPATELEQLWKTILLNQFHDILPGTSIAAVYEVTAQEYEAVRQQATRLIQQRLQSLRTDSGGDILVVNTAGRIRDDRIELPLTVSGGLQDQSGAIYPIRQADGKNYCFVKGIPAKGYKSFRLVEAEAVQAADEATFEVTDGRYITSPHYQIELNDKGAIRRLFDRQAERELIPVGQSANQFVVYEDKPIYYDNWDIDIYYTEKYWPVEDLTKLEVLAQDEQQLVIGLEWKTSQSKICQKMYLYRDSRRIDFKTVVDWKEHQHLLKVHFPLAIHTDEATFDIQFGNLTRKTHHNTSWDWARFESCGQKWVDLSEGHYGVSLLNDCKYGHSIYESNIGLTLIKSGIEPNPNTDVEEHQFLYSLYPHQGNWRQADTIAQAYQLNMPLYVATGEQTGDVNSRLGSAYSMVQTDQENVIIETVKKSEQQDGVILRMYEAHNARTKVKVRLAEQYQSITECNLIEEPTDGIIMSGDWFEFVIKPYEVKTFLLKK